MLGMRATLCKWHRPLDPCGELGKISGAARAALLILCTRPSGLFVGKHLVQLYGGCSSGQKPGPTFCGQRTKDRERERAFAKYANYDAVGKRSLFFSVIEPPTIPPSFAPVGRCVGRTRPGRHPLPTNNCLRPLSGQRGEKTRYLTPALAFLIKWQDDMRFAHNDWPHFRWRIPMFLEVNRGRKKQEKEPALLLRRFAHNFPQCGQLRDFERALFHT